MEGQDGYLPYPKGFSTQAIHAFQDPEQWASLGMVPPLEVATTYKQRAPADFKKFEYSRSGNPNRDLLEHALANLEGAKYGLCFASGMAATSSVLSIYQAGDHIVCGDDLYGGTTRLFTRVMNKFGLEVTPVDALNPDNIDKAIRENTKLIWIETPTNPMFQVVDIKKVAAIARKHKILLAVDNTFLTPYLQRPIELGADIVVHSISKYINGHSDVIMGAVVTTNEEFYNQLKFIQNAMGMVPAPFDCFQVTRSIKTLSLRMKQHSLNGLAVARFLEKHPTVEKVLHPGLESHPQHQLTREQTSGHSGVFSFYIKGGLKQATGFLSNLKVFGLAESLGGFESLAELPSLMTHASVPEERRKTLGISDTLVRLSVGLEDEEDLINDLQQAFVAIAE